MDPKPRKKRKKALFDKESFKKGIAYIESRGFKNPYEAVNETSSATGKYQFLWNELSKSNPNLINGMSRKEFMSNPDMQERVMDMAIEGGLKKRPSYFRNAKDLSNEFSKSKNFNFRPDEVAALSHFLGRSGARKYLQSLDDGSSFSTPGEVNKDPMEYITEYNQGIGSDIGMPPKQAPYANTNNTIRQQHQVRRDNTNLRAANRQFAGGGQMDCGGPGQPPCKDPRGFLLDYISSDKHKERLESSGYDPMVESAKRMSNVLITNVIEQKERPGLIQQVINKYNDVPYSTRGSKYDHEAKTIVYDPLQLPELSNNNVNITKNEVLSHEYGHALNYDTKANTRLNEKDFNDLYYRLKPTVKSNHSLKAEENHSDLQSFRYLLYEDGVYDTRKEEFNKEHLKKAKNSFIKNRLLENYKEDDLIWLMNNIAANKTADKTNQAAYGGQQNTGNMNELLTKYDGGGTHEQNPLGGIPIGMGQNGQMNTVEANETSNKGYVFSDRLKLKAGDVKTFKLPKKLKGKTIAEASKILTKEADESNNIYDRQGSQEMLDRLKEANEALKPVKAPQPGEPGMDQQQLVWGGEQSAMDIYNSNPSSKSWEGIKSGVATAYPVAGAFNAVEGFGKQIGQSIGGNGGGDFMQGALDPMSLKMRDDLNFGEKILSIDPFAAGMITKKKNKAIREEQGMLRTAKANNHYKQSDFRWGGPTEEDLALEEQRGIYDPNKIGNFIQGVGQRSMFPNLNTLGTDMLAMEIENEGIDMNPNLIGDFTNNVDKRSKNNNDFWGKIKGFIGNNKDAIGNAGNTALRMAPVATNALQLMNLDRPESERLDRNSTTYKRDFVDENSLVNQVNQQEANTRSALQESSGGDLGALRNNLLMSHVNSLKGRSGAFLQAENINRGENRTKQQFDNQNLNFNIGQSNMEKDINARNRAAYDNNKSKLLSQIGTDLGNIGLENIRKKYPQNAGLLYDYLGKYNS